MIYGSAPIVIGKIEIEEPEMMFVQYLPIMMPRTGMKIPRNLECVSPLVYHSLDNSEIQVDDYVYLTAKHVFVTPDNMGNRPGWHTDGFGSDDINFIWYDYGPTEFCVQDFVITDDHDISMVEMAQQAREENVIVYPEKTLLKLDAGVIHRVAINGVAGYRTFVKISISKDKYNLKGNAHNYLFDYNWVMHERAQTRNHPSI